MNSKGYQIVSESLFINQKQENPILKQFRLSRPYIYLFHGTPPNRLESIMKHGIKISYLGTH